MSSLFTIALLAAAGLHLPTDLIATDDPPSAELVKTEAHVKNPHLMPPVCFRAK